MSVFSLLRGDFLGPADLPLKQAVAVAAHRGEALRSQRQRVAQRGTRRDLKRNLLLADRLSETREQEEAHLHGGKRTRRLGAVQRGAR